MKIHQLLPGLHSGDAISNQAIALRRFMHSWGIESEIFARDISPGMHRECRPYSEFRAERASVSILHYSMDTELVHEFLASPGKRVIVYHNITPEHYLADYIPGTAQCCRRGRDRLGELAPAVDLALGVSEFNCRELSEKGFQNPQVLPIAVGFEEFESTQPCPGVLRCFGGGWVNFLFVGRLSPNKRQDDVIRAFAYYQRLIRPRSRLFLVGGWRNMESYVEELQALARACQVEDHVFFTGHVCFAELVAYYKIADLFLCLSEHEGFCVPLLEAFHAGVPVVAFAAAAIPETLGDAGLLIRRKDPALIAELAHRVLSDSDSRYRVLRRQTNRLKAYHPAAVAGRFREYLQPLIEG